MKRTFLTTMLLLAAIALKAQSISHIEATNAFYYVYDQNGKKIRTFSTSDGELKGYSASFYIIRQGTAFYLTYDAKGKRLHTFNVNTVGEILGVAGDTFTSRLGNWIFTWSKDGKKIHSRVTSQ